MEVFQLDVTTELVVLSACETGRGKFVRAEGIVGFARAFMAAGAPRVLVSLWKVDDKATQAMMVEFYKLWNPKDDTPALSASDALRKAQAHVRAQEKWKHPHYWAGWALWGVAD